LANHRIKMKSQKKVIYWFAYFNLQSPSTRYRAYIPLLYLQKNHNVEIHFIYPERSFLGIIRFLKTYFQALFFHNQQSLIVIQKVISNGFYAKALKLLIFIQRRRTLYDLDDAEYLRYPVETLHYFLRNCEKIAAGSDALIEYCQPFNSNIYWQTSPVPYAQPTKKRRNAKFHIGWIGDFGNGNTISQSFSHKTNLETLVFPALIQLNYPVKLSLIGIKMPKDVTALRAFFQSYDHIDLDIPTNLNWKQDKWIYPKICEFDVGIAPYVDHPFCHAKSAFKAKQYLRCGIPVIASKIGENPKFIEHGTNGFLFENSGELIQYLNKIQAMKGENYWKMSQNCLKTKVDFSVKKYGEKLIKKHF